MHQVQSYQEDSTVECQLQDPDARCWPHLFASGRQSVPWLICFVSLLQCSPVFSALWDLTAANTGWGTNFSGADESVTTLQQATRFPVSLALCRAAIIGVVSCGLNSPFFLSFGHLLAHADSLQNSAVFFFFQSDTITAVFEQAITSFAVLLLLNQ